ncbi:hypothetical protein J6590_064972 [Homalodisca vitripennis]|nr:hypothetical protein J6590_064972 [Homalodisca vitripennis]
MTRFGDNVSSLNKEEVKNKLDSLDRNKSCGLDGISSSHRHCIDLLVSSSSDLYNASLAAGVIPEILKCDLVTPIYTKCDNKDDFMTVNARKSFVITLNKRRFTRSSIKSYWETALKELTCRKKLKAAQFGTLLIIYKRHNQQLNPQVHMLLLHQTRSDSLPATSTGSSIGGRTISTMEEKPFDLSRLSMLSLNLRTNNIGATKRIFPSKQQELKLKLNYQDPLLILGEKSFGKPKETGVEEIGTPIQEFFRNSHVFITGGTGFLGKVLTEKLIRSIPHLEKIYLLIRTKRGNTAQERFQKMFEDKVFLRMKTEVPDYLSKVSFVEGDLSEPDLGLSEADRQMLSDKVNIVFHSAANVRFIEPLRVALESNLHGCERVLALAKRMKNLKPDKETRPADAVSRNCYNKREVDDLRGRAQ